MTSQCPHCGRFARAYEERGYDGTWDQIWIYTYCKTCGEAVRTVV